MWSKSQAAAAGLITADPLQANGLLEPIAGQFIKGINLGGDAVTIGGRVWLSDTAARAEGLNTPQVNFLTTNLGSPCGNASGDRFSLGFRVCGLPN